jgi:hypothetical protein
VELDFVCYELSPNKNRLKTREKVSNFLLFVSLIPIMCQTSVGRVSQFHDTLWVQFSQSNLQKGPVLPSPYVFKKKIDTGSHNAGSPKFENSSLSFAGSHKLGITFYKLKLKLNNY